MFYECSDKGGGMYKIAEGSYEHVAKGFEVTKFYLYTIIFSFSCWRRAHERTIKKRFYIHYRNINEYKNSPIG